MNSIPGHFPKDEYLSAERKHGARLLIAEAGVSAVPQAVHGQFIAALAIRLGASTLQIGLLTATTYLVSALCQLSAARLIGVLGGRKRMIITTVLLSALPWLFLVVVPFIPSAARIWALIPLAALALALLLISDPAWGSWVSDLVPRGRRGRFLGLRGSAITLVIVAVGVTAAAVLDKLDEKVIWGFATLFAVALVARLVSAFIFMRVVDPRPDLRIQAGESPWTQLTRLGKSTLGRYGRFTFAFNLCIGLMAPFIAVYILRDLEVTYLTFVSLGVASSLANTVMMPLWGRLADLKSTKLVLAISVTIMAVHPMLWLVSSQTWYLFLLYIVMGIGGAGFVVSAYNFVLEESEDEKRPAAVGNFRATAFLGVFGGALIGGIIASHVPTLFSYQVLTMLALSSVLRIVTVALLLPPVMGSEGLVARVGSLKRRHAPVLMMRQRLAAIWHTLPH